MKEVGFVEKKSERDMVTLIENTITVEAMNKIRSWRNMEYLNEMILMKVKMMPNRSNAGMY